MVAPMAVFGSFKLSTLQREAAAARQLGQYRLKERLGAGGMGEVYLAEHRLLKRPCALKLICPERAGDPEVIRRFEREVRAMARLTHFNTVEVFDYGRTQEGTFYYVMEYLAGPSLEQLVRRGGRLPAARAVHFVRQLCGALHEAHGVGLIHRDVKPGNVLVCRHGGLNDVVKLLDFGLVRQTGAAPGTQQLTEEHLVMGTPDYIAPEQAQGAAELDGRSDLYSLGALTFFLLTGEPPFGGATVLEKLFGHIHQSVRPPRALCPEVPADVEAVVLRCLEKTPDRRYQDATALERGLAACACADRWSQEDAAACWAS
jgi:serine/threonine-protein kinase